jgi:hypothetical protein
MDDESNITHSTEENATSCQINVGYYTIYYCSDWNINDVCVVRRRHCLLLFVGDKHDGGAHATVKIERTTTRTLCNDDDDHHNEKTWTTEESQII